MANLVSLKLERMDQSADENDGENPFPADPNASSSFVTSIQCVTSDSDESEVESQPEMEREVRLMKAEVTRVVGELALCKVLNSEKETLIVELRERIEVQNEQLQEAEDLIGNLQARVEELEEVEASKGESEEVEVDLREMKAMVASERAQRIALQGKYDKLKSSMEQFGKEFKCFVAQVRDIANEGTDDEDDYEDFPLQENKLETVLENTNKRFQKWAERQNQFKVQLSEMTELVSALAGVVKSQPPISKRVFPTESLNPPESFEAMSPGDEDEWEKVEDVPETVPIITNTFGITSTSERVKCQHGQDPENPLSCLCGRTFLHRYNISKHLKYFSCARNFSCSVCSKRYMNASLLREHYRRSHKINSALGEGVGCGKCAQMFPDGDAYHKHKKNCTGQANSYMEGVPEPPDVDVEGAQEVEAVRRVNYSGNRHGMNIGLRHQGYFCICGKNFISRKSLDGHIGFHMSGRSMQIQNVVEPEYVALGREETLKQLEISYGQDILQREGISLSSRTHGVHPEGENRCLCGYQANSRPNLSKHLTYFTSEKIFKCDLCPARYVNTSYLRQHYSRAHKEISEEILRKIKSGCKICAKLFPSRKAYLKHYLKEHDSSTTKARTQEPYELRMDQNEEECQYETFEEAHEESPIPIVITIDDDDDEEFVTACTDTFQDNFVAKHETTNGGDDPLQITKAGDGKSHEEDISKQSPGKFYCICGVSFSMRKNLLNHVRELKSQGKFKCNACERRFLYPSVLKRHFLRTHKIHDSRRSESFPRPFSGLRKRRPTTQKDLKVGGLQKRTRKRRRFPRFWCKPCGKYFKQTWQLIQHKKMFHKEILFDELKARVNRRQAIQDQQLKQSIGTPKHSDASEVGGDPACSCGREYLSKKGLAKHIRLKNRGKLFQCKWCSKFYEEYASLKKHARKVHSVNVPKEAHVCRVCQQICNSLPELKTHREEFH